MINQKNIYKYYENRKTELLKIINIEADKVEEKFFRLKKKYDEDISSDKYLLIQSFLNGTLDYKDYEDKKIMDEYLKLVPQTLMENGSKRAIKEITQNSIKFLNSLY